MTGDAEGVFVDAHETYARSLREFARYVNQPHIKKHHHKQLRTNQQ